jgi:hypothetical protein
MIIRSNTRKEKNTEILMSHLGTQVYLKGNLILDTLKGTRGFEVKGWELRKNHGSLKKEPYGIDFTGKVKL